MRPLRKYLFAFAAAILVGLVASAQPTRISVAMDQPGYKIAATLWGIFFEDINLSADGGIYPDVVSGDRYTLKLAARVTDGFSGALTARILGADGKEIATGVNYEPGGKITSLYATAAIDETSHDIIVKVVNANPNSLEPPAKVSPKTEKVSFTGNALKRTFLGNSFTVLRLSAE